jgi:carbon-monoxide dehydrogenase medium subunit
MKAAPFEYARPNTLAEACAALAQDGAAAIAGGQSLLPMLNLRVAIVDLVVDIGRLADLKTVRETSTALEIGALVTHAAIEDGKIPDPFNGLLRRVAGQISYRAVRNHGTIGGSLALADPAADWPACLMALGASVKIAGRDGTRGQPVADFVQGAYTTSLVPGEIITGIELPKPRQPLRWGFAKVARKSGAFANSIAIVTSQGRGGPASVVLGAAGPRPCRLGTAERQLAAGAGEDAIRAAIADDIAKETPNADAYERRMHGANVWHAVRELQRR